MSYMADLFVDSPASDERSRTGCAVAGLKCLASVRAPESRSAKGKERRK
jgi:hypothetical protein